MITTVIKYSCTKNHASCLGLNERISNGINFHFHWFLKTFPLKSQEISTLKFLKSTIHLAIFADLSLPSLKQSACRCALPIDLTSVWDLGHVSAVFLFCKTRKLLGELV